MSIFTVLAARNLFDRRTALFTLLAMLASSVLVVGLRLRHDIGVGLTISASLWVYSVARKRNSWALHGVAGFCAGLGLGAHYHALGLSIALAAGLYLPEYFERIHRKQFFPQPEAIAYCCGAMISGLLILALQVLPDIQQFQEYLAPRSPHSLQEFVESVIYHVAQLPQHSQLEFIFVVVALSAALLRRTKLDISLSLVLILSYIALGAMASKNYGPFDYYSVPLIPLLGLLVGRFWGSLNIGRLLPTSSSSIAVVSCLCFLIPQLGYSLHSPLAYIRADGSLRPNPTPAAQWVLDHVRPDQTIMAENLYFIWLYEYPFLSPLTPTYLPSVRQNETNVSDATKALEAAWAELSPDVIIIDPTLSTSAVLTQLRASGFLPEHGYQSVFTAETANHLVTTIYERK